MAGNWRLYPDECVDARATEALIREGVDAASSHTLGRDSSSDSVQLAFAAAIDRTLLTHDPDFIVESERHLKAGNHHAGVLLVPDRQDLRWLLRAVRYSLERWSPEEDIDQTWWLVTPPDDEG